MSSADIRGFVAQGMDGRKASMQGYTTTFQAGTYTFTPPSSGVWKFVAWGAGSNNANSSGGASGAYGEITRPLTSGQPVTVVVGTDGGVDTKLTFKDGKVCTAGTAVGTTPGAASGFDVNLAGSAAAAAGLGTGGGAAGTGGGFQGAGAPANLPFRGGRGGNGATTFIGGGPGAGCGPLTTGAQGCDGMVIALLVSQ